MILGIVASAGDNDESYVNMRLNSGAKTMSKDFYMGSSYVEPMFLLVYNDNLVKGNKISMSVQGTYCYAFIGIS